VGYPVAEQGQHAQGKGNIRRGGNGPAGKGVCITLIHGDVDQGGHGHAADRGDSREHDAGGIGQFPLDELALDLEANKKEKNGHQAIIDPQQQRLVKDECAELDTDGGVEQGIIEKLQRRVLDAHSEDCRGDDQQTTGGFLLQKVLYCMDRHGNLRRRLTMVR
jgi:hypothetical protein